MSKGGNIVFDRPVRFKNTDRDRMFKSRTDEVPSVRVYRLEHRNVFVVKRR